MQRIAEAVSFVVLLLSAASAGAQSSAPVPPPEVRKWEIFAGDWALSGTAKDGPAKPEYRVNWLLHEHWILGGFFLEADQVWKGNGQESRALEILSYDRAARVYRSSGFSSDGSTWNLTASFHDTTVVEEGVSGGPGQSTRCRMTWVFSPDRRSLSGTQECEQNGQRWTSLRVQGSRSRSTH